MAAPGPTDDLLERHPISNERHNCGIGFLASQITFKLQSFRTGEQLRIDRRRADCGPDHAHGPAHRPEEGRARVFHQVPAIGDLDGVRERFGRGLAVAAAAVARHHPDPGMLRKPSPHRCNLAVGQQRHDPPPLQIADNCSVTVIPPEGPVINAGNDQRLGRRAGSSPDYPQQRIVAHGQHQSLGETCCWRTAECQAQMMDDAFQPCCSARPHRHDIVTEPLSENPPMTMRDVTDKPPRDHSEAYLPARAGQIRDLSGVSAMNSARRSPAQRALGRARFRPDGQNNRVR
jgi:hypothetical protein